MMDERQFMDAASRQMATIENALDAIAESDDAPFDIEIKPGGVIELEFADGSAIIINMHAAAREIWLAAKSGGMHFRLDGERWIGTRDGEELMAALARTIALQSGRALSSI